MLTLHYLSTWQEQFIPPRLVAPYTVTLGAPTGSAQGHAPGFQWIFLRMQLSHMTLSIVATGNMAQTQLLHILALPTILCPTLTSSILLTRDICL